MRRWLLATFLIAACETAPGSAPPATRLVLQPDPYLGNPSPYPSAGALHDGVVRRPDSSFAASLQLPSAFSAASQIWMRFEGPPLDVSALPVGFGSAETAPIVVESAGRRLAYRATYNTATNLLSLHLMPGTDAGEEVTVHVRPTLRNMRGGPVAARLEPPIKADGDGFAFSYPTVPVRQAYDDVYAASAAIRKVDAAPFEVYAPVALPSGRPVTALAERLPVFGWGIEAGDGDAPLTGLGAVIFGTLTLAAARDTVGTLPRGDLAQALRAETVPFMLVLPQYGALSADVRAMVGTPPRYPVVIFGHGYTACKESLLGVAASFAREGLALLAIDAVGHGERTGGKPKCGLALPTGFGLDVTTLGASFFDTIQQTRQLTALVPAIAVRVDVSPADGTPDLAAGPVGYVGQSMGAINGVATSSLDKNVGAAVFNVGLAGIGATLFSRGADEVPGAAFDPTGFLADIAALDLADMPYEPLHFTAGLAAKPVLVQQAEFDELVPALGSETLALALDAVQAQGDPRPVAGLASARFPLHKPAAKHFRSVFAGVDHIFLIHRDESNPGATAGAQTQAAVFLRTALTGEELVVPDGKSP